jgi:hypothetical protein
MDDVWHGAGIGGACSDAPDDFGREILSVRL